LYTYAVVVVAVLVTWWGLKETHHPAPQLAKA